MTASSGTAQFSTTPALFIRRLAAGVFLLNLFVIVLLVLSLRQSRLQYEERAAITSRNLSLILEQYLAGDIEKIDLDLLSVAEEIEHRHSTGGTDEQGVETYIARQKSHLPYLDGLRTTNLSGEIDHGAGAATAARISVADRDYFVRLRDDPKAGLVISKPLVSRVSGKWVIIYARRLNLPDGSFGGVVYATIALDYFTRTFSRLNVGRHGTISLRDDDLRLVARYPWSGGNETFVGQKRVSNEFRGLVQAGKTEGTYVARTPVDNIVRTFSYRKVSTHPLYINIGLASEDYLADWWNVVRNATALVGLFALSTLLSSWFIYRAWARGNSAMQALHVSKEQIRTLLESTAEAIYGVDLQGRCTFANPACVKLLGYGHPDELLGQQLHYLCHHTHADGTPFPIDECRIAKSFEDGKGIHVDDEVFWRKDGSSFPVECWSYPQLNNNEVVGAVVTFLDITERRRAEAELKESRQHLLDIIDFLPDATFVVDTEGRVTAWNRAIEQMSGVGKADMLGKGDHACTVPFYGERRPHLIDLIDVDDRELELKYRHVRRNGDRLYAEVFTPALYNGEGAYVWATVAPLFDIEGKRVGAIEAIRDITLQKQAEEAIVRYRDHLEELVRQRTGELAEAKEAAEAASKAKSEFMAIMSHELHTPLNAIIGFSDLALMNGLSDEQQKHIRKIQDAGKSLRTMINEILDFSRIEAGTMELERVEFRLEDFLVRVLSDIQQKAFNKGLDLLLSLDRHIPQPLSGVPGALEQVLSSLLDNAVKFTECGEVELALELVEQDYETVLIGFSVRDAGIGMKPEQMRNLFQPFTQGDGSSTRKHGGTGIGLTLCQRLAEMMGSTIKVESVPGEGSIFSFAVWCFRVPGARDVQPVRPLGSYPWIDTACIANVAAANEKLFRELLRRFRREQHDAPDRIRTALREGDSGSTARIAHTLKGLAGTIGASGIEEAALEVERAIRSGEDPSASLDILAGRLEEFVAGLLATADEEVAGSFADPTTVACDDPGQVLNRLEQYVLDNDGEAVDYLGTVVGGLRATHPAAPWDELIELLDRYDFDKAAGLVRQVIEGLG